VACDDSGRVVGGAGYAPIDEDGHDAAERIAELQKLYVSKESRGLGASYRLIDAVESHARRDGYTTLYLETHHVLEAAMHVYERRGFQLIDAPLGHAQHTTMDRFYIKSLA
jgi:putative acetyltransferase